MALTHGDDITKDAPALGGKGHILVVAAKEPLFVGQLQQDLIKEQMQAVGFALREGSKIKESAWGIVGQHIIYLLAVCFEIGLTGGVFLIAGHLLRPPVESGLPLFLVGALCAAKTEIFLSLQLQHAAAAHMVHIAAQSLDPAAKTLLDGVLGQQVVILVGTIKEKQGIGALALLVELFLFFLAVIAALTVPSWAILRNAKGGFLPKSPFFAGIITLIAFFFVSTGLPYGVATGEIKKWKDIPRLVSAGLREAIPLLTTTMMAAVFIDMMNKSNIFKMVAVAGAEALRGANIGLLPLCLTIIVVTTIINPFMTSGSSKWLIIAPMIVPMFTMLNVHPAYAQLAYRFVDSATNICSPLQELLPVIIGMLTQYLEEGKIPLRPGETEHRKIGIGTIFS